MNCKHCQAPLEDGNSVCPSCGWDNSLPEETETIAFSPEETAQAPATPEESSGSPEQDLPSPGEASDSQPKPVNRKKLALVIGGAVLVLALIAVAIWFLARPAESLPTEPAESTASTTDTTPEETAEPTGVLVREDYTFEGDDITPELSKAVATMGDATLSNGLLQIFYWRSYYDFLNNYSSYIAYIGLDTTKPLNEQTCGMSSTTMTWEQFFLDNALQTWAQYQAVRLDAEAAGYTISEGTQTQLNSSAQQLETSAQQYGFDSVQAMLEADFGAGVTAETYQSYMELYMTSMDYYYSQMDALTPSAEEVEAYYDENQETFTQNGIDKNETPATINVRHILIQPEGEKAGTDDNGNAVYSEEQLAAAKEKAQALYDQWLAGEATEASFADLVADNSADTGSVSNGGLYEGVAPNQMVTEFNDWCFDPTRKAGDTGLVETEFGCHIMYFVSASEKTYWYTSAESQMMQERSTQLLQTSLENHPYEVDYDAIVLGKVQTSTTNSQ